MDFAFQILALLVIAGTFVPRLRSDIWIVRSWDFPQVQLALVGIFAGAGMLICDFQGLWWHGAILILLGLALVRLGLVIFPYTRLAKQRVVSGNGKTRLSVMVSNVLMSNRESEKLIELLRTYEPDLFVALETDQWWVDQLAEVAGDYPHAVELPQDDTYGMLLRSRIPLENAEVEYLVRKNIPSIHFAVELDDGTHVQMHALHPKPPFPDEDTSSTDRDAELMMVGKRVKDHPGPSIVFGDMNDVAWSHTTRLFQRTSSLLDPRMGRGFFSTFHAEHRWMRWPLDHLFVSREFRVCRMERLPYVGSDHFPIFAEFSYEPDKQAANDPLDGDADDRKEAAKKVAAVQQS
ncbi:endonuclease/exonuclease/phosphatase family protein [Luteolibacter pohnpeiensis]|uniref:Endonuclease/exonuclease/phosphatase family protein n=1 Tax=Luteolibacter pohnpeiensis TaxID=454153 RepID=A0A934VVJ8_9BACT|nr:endonuclease/exonuclease/phosphatase family protein [Luteolibacter pohnpeiensis]MBK1882260.1 endonuclease/exonuclease/phosphatase family protein [Luteolibacter pohnpeiensis]